MTIHLHIGTSKTGTSTIQRFFDANRDALAERGYLYPRAPGDRNHTMLAIYAGEPASTRDLRIAHPDVGADASVLERVREQFGAALRAECGDARQVVLSNEHCYTRLQSDEEVERLHALLSDIDPDVRVICYLRRQDEHLLSGYSTALVSGSTETLDLDDPMTWPQLHSYHTALDRWARVFGEDRIVARVYERRRWVDGDIIADLLEAIGLDDDGAFERVPPVNESLDASTLEFLRLFNRDVPRISKGKINPLRGGLIGQLAKLSDGPRLALEPGVAERYVAAYEDENRSVAGRFIKPATDELFDPEFPAAVDDRPELDVERAVEIAAALYNWRSRALTRVRSRVAELEADVARITAERDDAVRTCERLRSDADERRRAGSDPGSMRGRLRKAFAVIRGREPQSAGR